MYFLKGLHLIDCPPMSCFMYFLQKAPVVLVKNGEKPPLSHMLNYFDFEAVAKSQMTQEGWDYYSSGCDDEITLRENHDAFHRYHSTIFNFTFCIWFDLFYTKQKREEKYEYCLVITVLLIFFFRTFILFL